jgi:hypothetical protein
MLVRSDVGTDLSGCLMSGIAGCESTRASADGGEARCCAKSNRTLKAWLRGEVTPGMPSDARKEPAFLASAHGFPCHNGCRTSRS